MSCARSPLRRHARPCATRSSSTGATCSIPPRRRRPDSCTRGSDGLHLRSMHFPRRRGASRRLRRRERSRVAVGVSERGDSPNLEGLDAYAFEPERIDKPWGYELIWAHSEQYVGKILFVRAGEELSLQFHNHKDETIYLQQGRIEIEISAPGVRIPEVEVATAGAAFRIRPGTIHRWRALEDSVVLEASTPDLEDVVRLEDRYGRAEL